MLTKYKEKIRGYQAKALFMVTKAKEESEKMRVQVHKLKAYLQSIRSKVQTKLQ